MQSAAAIHASMLLTKPFTTTCTLGGHDARSRLRRISSFFPHTTTTWLGFPGSTAASALARDSVISFRFPIPSPPPTTSAVRAFCTPSSRRMAALSRPAPFQKPGLWWWCGRLSGGAGVDK